MGERVEKRYTWVLKNFSDLQAEPTYSLPFVFAGCNWNIIAYPKGYEKCRHLSLFLGIVNPESLPSGWRRELKFRLTLVNKLWSCDTKVLEGQSWFDASSSAWGFKEFIPLSTVRFRDNKFLVGDKLVIVAELHLFPLVVETVKIIEPLSCNEGSQVAADESRNAAASSQEKVDFDVSQDIPSVDASEEGLDDDAGASQEGSDDDAGSEEGQNDDDDDASSLVSEDGSKEKGLLNQSNSLKEGSLTVENCGMMSNNVASETEVSNVDDAPIEDPEDDDDVIEHDQGDDNASSLASGVSDRDVGSLNKFEGTSQREEDGDIKCDKVASVTEASNDFPEKVQPVKETKYVNGFQVFSSQVESVSHIFKRHPDIALEFRPKNQEIRRAYMNELLSLIEMLCQSPEKLSEDDLSNADDTLADLIDVGFKLDWLKIKLDEVSEKKKKEKGSETRLQTMEEQLLKLKLMFLNLETQLQKEKEEALAARAPLSFNDVVY
ncbi:TRAF-like superfamily protein [Raphanus sativus]|nr:TRAF-like superfamily protein [Raphanus sativus]